MDDLELCLYDLESFQTIWKVSRRSKKCPDHPENVAGLSKILENHLLCAFVTDLKIDAIYPEFFCHKNLAIRKVFAFCDSDPGVDSPFESLSHSPFIIQSDRCARILSDNLQLPYKYNAHHGRKGCHGHDHHSIQTDRSDIQT